MTARSKEKIFSVRKRCRAWGCRVSVSRTRVCGHGRVGLAPRGRAAPHRQPRSTHVKPQGAHGPNRPGPKVPSSLDEVERKYGSKCGKAGLGPSDTAKYPLPTEKGRKLRPARASEMSSPR
jgi:hypothetical protein